MHRTSELPSWLSQIIAVLLLASSPFATAYDLDPNSTGTFTCGGPIDAGCTIHGCHNSITATAKTMASDLVAFYQGDQLGHTPGLLPDPYYWWEAGAMMGSLIDYWYYTKDDQYVNLTTQALLFQTGDNHDYMPINQTRTEGNDDQGFWGLAVMSAAEYNFPNPDPNQPQWLALAQAVFNTQAARWESDHCGGGLRWQIFQWNNGYTYKNSISQACFFALGARLALFTGNKTYADWADKTWDWMVAVEFLNTDNWYVYDGAHIETNCTEIVPYQFSYNAGGFILGAAAMYNYTEDQVWKDRLDNLIQGSKVFFTGPEKNIMTEVACEPVDLCNLDQKSFKAYLSRWLAATTQWAPHTYEVVMPWLRASAVAAAKQCTGGDNGRLCGLVWNKDKYDGTTGVGQQMAAMEVTLSCMVADRGAPLTKDSGGTSKGDPGGGGQDIGRTEPDRHERKITSGDKAGAAILTILVLGGLIAGIIWLFLDETSDRAPLDQFKGFSSNASASIAALAAGGGIAAILHRNKSGDEINEKHVAHVATLSESSSQVSSNGHVGVAATPMHIGNVRNETEGFQRRRTSSMPLGWSQSQNRTMRASTMFEPEGNKRASGYGIRAAVIKDRPEERSHSEQTLHSPVAAQSPVATHHEDEITPPEPARSLEDAAPEEDTKPTGTTPPQETAHIREEEGSTR
ncbi:hypothetical protein G7046_g6222 [Stylonectria norvegica]|nr:hypothetical protein G7046_g6222 [Stylonectria norvegica]